MMDAPGICFGGSRWWGGRSSLATGFAASPSRFTNHAQKLDRVDWRTRMVLSARSAPAISSIHAWMVGEVRSVTRASRPYRLRTKIKNCSRIHR